MSFRVWGGLATDKIPFAPVRWLRTARIGPSEPLVRKLALFRPYKSALAVQCTCGSKATGETSVLHPLHAP